MTDDQEEYRRGYRAGLEEAKYLAGRAEVTFWKAFKDPHHPSHGVAHVEGMADGAAHVWNVIDKLLREK